MIIELLKEQLVADIYEGFPLFGTILFTEANPYVVKVLKDKEYFAALDEVSGPYLAVFVAMLFLGELKYPKPPPGEMPMLKPIWKEPLENLQLLPFFEIKDSRELPFFVLFGFDQDDFYYQKYPIRANSEAETFDSLREVFINTTSDVQKYTNKRDLFRHAQWELRKMEAQQTFKRFLETIALFRGAAGT